jgi:DNA-binding IscR family transcriptional regulator
MLAKDPMEISVWDIMVSVEDFVEPVKCLGASDHCSLEEECIAKDAWSEIYRRMKKELHGLKIGSLMRHDIGEVPRIVEASTARPSCGSL